MKAKNPGASRRILERKRERERWGGMGEGNEICLRVECGDCLKRKISKSHIFNASATADTKPTTVFLRPTLRPSTSPLQILSSPSLSLSLSIFSFPSFSLSGFFPRFFQPSLFFFFFYFCFSFFVVRISYLPTHFCGGGERKEREGFVAKWALVTSQPKWFEAMFIFFHERGARRRRRRRRRRILYRILSRVHPIRDIPFPTWLSASRPTSEISGFSSQIFEEILF